jgi:hypothetical protein
VSIKGSWKDITKQEYADSMGDSVQKIEEVLTLHVGIVTVQNLIFLFRYAICV